MTSEAVDGRDACVARLFEQFATLLEYPAAPIADACAAAISECSGVDARAAVQVAAYAGAVTDIPPHELQELYTRTFDFDADTTLYIGHHLFGEDGRRGLLLAGLIDRYRTLDLDIGVELADHVAPVLRSLARDSTSEEASELIRDALLPAIAKALPAIERRAPAYAALLTALLIVARARTGRPSDFEIDAWTSSSLPFSPTLR